MVMIGRAASMAMASAWAISKLHHFRMYWHAHSHKYRSAELLLQSEVCTKPRLRMELRDYDQCDNALSFTRIAPFSRAVYSLAEEVHICALLRLLPCNGLLHRFGYFGCLH